MNYKHWLISVVVLIILEILPPPTHFYFLCLAFGALAAAISSLFSGAVWIDWLVFAVVSVASIPLLVPLARFLFSPRPTASNADEIIGQDAVVMEPVEGREPGTVRVRGELWRALSEDGPHAQGETVRILRIEGTHVIIRRLS